MSVMGSTSSRRPSVLVAHQHPLMRRLLRLNFEGEGISVLEFDSFHLCLSAMKHDLGNALVLDPGLIDNAAALEALRCCLWDSGIPAVVYTSGPEHRAMARALGGLPYFFRIDDFERVVTLVCDLAQRTRRVAVHHLM